MTTARTRNDEAVEYIRDQILQGRFAPGSRLGLELLADELGVSRSVVREALNRLMAQGLVNLLPQQGFRVTEATADDLRDLSELRVLVECRALAMAIQHGDLEWEQSIVGALHGLERTPARAAPGEPVSHEWVRVHAAFHQALISACPNARLTGLATHLRQSAEVYRQWSSRQGEERNRDVAAEHRALAEATLARDHARASRLLAEHLELTTKLAIESAPR